MSNIPGQAHCPVLVLEDPWTPTIGPAASEVPNLLAGDDSKLGGHGLQSHAPGHYGVPLVHQTDRTFPALVFSAVGAEV